MSDLDLLPKGEQAVRSSANAPARDTRAALRAVWQWLHIEPWRSTVIGAVAAMVLGLLYWTVAPRTYRARAVVAPSSGRSLSRLPSALSGLVGQLGINTELDPTTTPSFYSLLGQSESIRREVLFKNLPPRSGARDGRPVWRAIGVKPCDSLCILRQGLRKLASVVDITVERQTGTFEIAATLRDPYEAAGVVNMYIEAVDRFNRDVRRTQAKASRQFLEGRVAAVNADLKTAEDSLQQFYERNVRWQSSPRLVIEEGRLRRVIEARSELLSNLVRQLEVTRLDEVNSTPLLSVIDSAMPPLRKYSPRGSLILVGALVTGALFGFALGMVRIN